MTYNIRLLTWVVFFTMTSFLQAQVIWSEPEFPDQNGPVTVYFDASSCDCPLQNYTGDIYAHTGIITTVSNGWTNVIGNWGDNSVQPKLKNEGNGVFSLEILPSIKDFYAEESSSIRQMAFVFRSSDGSSQTADLFLDVYDQRSINILTPVDAQIVDPGVPFRVHAVLLGADSMRVEWDGRKRTFAGAEVDFEITLEESGMQTIVFQGFGETSSESKVSLLVRDELNYAPLPNQELKGGVFTENGSSQALFVLEAPAKKHVFLIGDFNDWTPDREYQMNADTQSGFFWLRLSDLDPDTEYAYQYIVDGNLFLADPYCEKILDPDNDPFIDDSTYPELKPYPEDANGIVSTFKINEESYEWKNDGYERPKKEELKIYELLLREFTFEHTYQSVIDRLNYLEDLGINAIELMPVNEFEGNSSWGYNTSFHFAVDKYYGTKNDLKRFVDACHERGIAVLLDIVLNHTYSQNPMVQMYWDEQRSRPAADNPWFNESSPNQVFSFGYDMDHESPRTRRYSKQVLEHWIEEYHIDGYRLDFTKGLTNVPGDGGGYDPSRITILKDYADHIWSVDPESIVILEHFAPQREEAELADEGMMLWGNLNYSFSQMAMGYLSGSSVTGADYRNRGFSEPLLIPYMESHDEERQMYKTLNFGNAHGDYNTNDFATAIERSKMASTIYFAIPGPKLIWMFGELGFDISIDDPCRICEKPVFWPFSDDEKRKELLKHYSRLLNIRDSFDIFHTNDFQIGGNGTVKWVMLRKDDTRVLALINMDVEEQKLEIDMEKAGVWHEYFSGTKITLDDTRNNFTLPPGAYRMYSTFELGADFNPEVNDESIVFPNPSDGLINYELSFQPEKAILYDTKGAIVHEWDELQSANGVLTIDIPVFGCYYLQFQGRAGEENVQKIVLYTGE